MSTVASKVFKVAKITGFFFVTIFALTLLAGYIQSKRIFSDHDRDRGSTSLEMNQPDLMGDHFSKVIYPEQGWSPAESLYFYNTTQGSNLIPYDFMMVLEQNRSTDRFLEADNINRYRYLVQKKTDSNPDGLPVGLVKDTYTDLEGKSRTYMGFTCAACHTNQVVVRKDDNSPYHAVRVDGGPAAANMTGFLADIRRALEKTLTDGEKRQRFTQAVLERGEYESAEEVEADLLRYLLRFQLYDVINKSQNKTAAGKTVNVEYGYARLDAFGRIFNRVIEHLLTDAQIRDLLRHIDGLSQQQINEIVPESNTLLSAREREGILREAYLILSDNNKKSFSALRAITRGIRDSGVFNYANAPVSYPFLWDIAQHDYVQWNGIASNTGIGPMGRNVGEVIGVFATLDWHKTEKCGLMGRLSGQCSLFGEPTKKDLIRFTSSVNTRNLQRIESLLGKLQSPLWNDRKLSPAMPLIGKTACQSTATDGIPQLAAKCTQHQQGRDIFIDRCIMCHQDIDRDDPYRKVVAFMGDVAKVGTDPTMALNSVSYTGKSGMLKDLIVDVTGGNGALVMQEEMPVASLLTFTTRGVVATPDPDKDVLTAGFEWLVDVIRSVKHNPITEQTNRQGDYPLSTEARPFASLKAYKGRPLNGIWATAPYLHNGSVPTLYHLFLPSECPDTKPACVDGVDKRPSHFKVGSRVLDTKLVGFKYQGYEGGFDFDTSLPGNSNRGHEYAACGTAIPGKQRKGCVALNHDQRMALVEYLKSL